MKIAFIGGGQLASSVAVLARAKGHDCVFGVRNPAKTGFLEFPRTGYDEAIAGADIVIIAVPYLATGEVLPPLAAALAGKVVIDTTNAVKEDWSPLPTGEENSGAERIQALLPEAYVAKAFNTIFAEVIHPHRLDRAGHKISLFVASDHPQATRTVMAFGAQIGFDAINAGPLKSARYLEAIAHLNLQLAFGEGDGMNTAIIYHRAH
ncbi:NAD(P)-binding domain-containing protein [Pseudomonas sp. SZMC_28357]|uniref:NADPH-dependent F420 reductase n=1 Tax=Pseudomonas sp. SZMC_28357 TaxID=3074380 RepID=UPI0028717F9B|nr:NAD(P)-binding domain-containing protein [Pseudomonas sp. SZMC_28357]MDR9754936.1 NAD(P)-binding domain-containing protein [Pseudomonas sp. SZMC_28357]